ncbi:helix-turn-helix transcriptional regulator [Ruegeria sediminis]|uniref:Helix-turn-helix transcriptional regulator n=1 Tax=Ruegeria sediminis TaxID=2583820 RepID=A0ABY2WWH2_9RHOB|nr:helix-turn-helix transcriptional regulator [Ruegeria sediminis]TMV06454.1 helix-turn-helix transcriptional regulator [Ruegeria sediminis]
MNGPIRSPAELRRMFGANLRHLASRHPTVIGLTKELGINRTQFNRYLSGESFPRPDVLDRICRFFDVDARILLEPVESISVQGGLLTGDILRDFLGAGTAGLGENEFPSGYFRFLRRCFPDTERYSEELWFVFRDGPYTFIRGYHPRKLWPGASAALREYRGYVSRMGDGLCLVASQRSAASVLMFRVGPAPASIASCWSGHVLCSANGDPSMRVVLEHLGHDLGAALQVARRAGTAEVDALSDPYRHLLRLEATAG